jgi:hypothetical protein
VFAYQERFLSGKSDSFIHSFITFITFIMTKEQETRNPNRHSQWLPQAAFSTLCLVSIVNPLVGDLKDQTKELKWSFSALIISLGFSVFAIFANYLLLKGKFQGTRVEGVMVSEITV